MRSINHHSSTVIVLAEESDEKMILNVYDSSYPVSAFRGFFSILGGNAAHDKSPKATVIRELKEECGLIDPEKEETVGSLIGSEESDRENNAYLKGRIYVSEEKRKEIFEAITKNMKGVCDVIVTTKKEHVGADQDVVHIDSVFVSRIPREVFLEIEKNVQQRIYFLNEGMTTIITVDDLVSGRIKGAWGHATAIGYALGVDIPEVDFIHTEVLERPPLDSYTEYKKEFTYEKDPE